MRNGHIRKTLVVIQLVALWRFVHFMINTYPDSAHRFAQERTLLLQEVIQNCENLIRNVMSFESACTTDEIPSDETSLCRGVRGVRHDARVCLERVSNERALLSNLSLLSVIRGLSGDMHRSQFNRDLLAFVSHPSACANNSAVLCVDWSCVFGFDLLTSLVFGILPFATTTGAWTSLLLSLLVFAIARGIGHFFAVEVHRIIRKHRRSRIIHFLLPLELIHTSGLFWLISVGLILFLANTTAQSDPRRSLLIRSVFFCVDTPLWKFVYFCTIAYLTLVLSARFTNVSSDMFTKLALEELGAIEMDIVRLWLESDPADLDRLSDAALIEILLRCNPSHIGLPTNELLFYLERRPCLKLLLDQRHNISSLCYGGLQQISTRLCLLFQGRNHKNRNLGVGIGCLLVVVTTLTFGDVNI